MTSTLAAADAKQRATRTLVQSLAVDAALVVLGAITAAILGTLEAADPGAYLTGTFWLGVAVLALKSGVVALVSWAARRVAAPAPLDT